MQSIVLNAKPRDKKVAFDGKKKAVPAILYGREVENKLLWLDYQEFHKAYNQAGESTVLEVSIEGNGENHRVLIYDVQYNPVTDEYQHVDFYEVKMDEEITAEVELVFVGEAPAVKEKGGVLVKNIDAVEVTSLPGDLPSEITVDISVLETFDDYIYVKDLKISDKVKLELEPETVIALVAPPRTEEELKGLDEKVEMDIEKVEGVKKEEPQAEGEKKA